MPTCMEKSRQVSLKHNLHVLLYLLVEIFQSPDEPLYLLQRIQSPTVLSYMHV